MHGRRRCAAALLYFQEALTLARELDRIADAGAIAAHRGFAHKQLGEREEATKWLRAGYALQLSAGGRDELEHTLVHLAETHLEGGEGDATIECYRLLRHHQREWGNRLGELKTNLRMAEAYCLARRRTEALTLFEEGHRLSREVRDPHLETLCVMAIRKLQQEQQTSD